MDEVKTKNFDQESSSFSKMAPSWEGGAECHLTSLKISQSGQLLVRRNGTGESRRSSGDHRTVAGTLRSSANNHEKVYITP